METGTGIALALTKLVHGAFAILFSSSPAPTVHVIGLLAASKPKAQGWFASFFLAYKDLFTMNDHEDLIIRSTWVAAASAELGSESKENVKIVKGDLKTAFCVALVKTAFRAKPHDILVLILCGHGQELTGDLIIRPQDDLAGTSRGSQEIMTKSDVESALGDSKVPSTKIILISTACYNAPWRSERWTPFCPAERNKEFVAALTGEGLGETFATPGPEFPIPLPSEERFTPHLACRELPSTSRPVQRLLSRLFTAEYSCRLAHIAANRPPEARSLPVPPVILPPQLAPLSDDDAAELLLLSKRVRAFHFENTPRAWPVLAMAGEVVRGVPIDLEREHRLLRQLRCWWRDCRRATAIATHMNWSAPHPVDQWSRPQGLREMRLADAAGAKVLSEFGRNPQSPRWSLAPGAWLSDAWIRAGPADDRTAALGCCGRLLSML
ncbi:hypothetical protein C8F01DRAFT_1153090, partial [Mycena amicta]